MNYRQNNAPNRGANSGRGRNGGGRKYANPAGRGAGPNTPPRADDPGQQRGSCGNGPNRPPRAGGPGQQRGSSGNLPNNGGRTNGRRQQARASGQAQNAWVNGPPANQKSAPVTTHGQDSRVDDNSTQRKPAQPTPRLAPVVDSDGFTKHFTRTQMQRRKEAARNPHH